VCPPSSGKLMGSVSVWVLSQTRLACHAASSRGNVDGERRSGEKRRSGAPPVAPAV